MIREIGKSGVICIDILFIVYSIFSKDFSRFLVLFIIDRLLSSGYIVKPNLKRVRMTYFIFYNLLMFIYALANLYLLTLVLLVFTTVFKADKNNVKISSAAYVLNLMGHVYLLP